MKMMYVLTIAFALTAGILIDTDAHAVPIAGSATGIFQNPTGEPGASSRYTGVGTSQLGWGVPEPNHMANWAFFPGVSFESQTGIPIFLGNLLYHNAVSGLALWSVELKVDVAFATPSGVAASFTLPLAFTATPNSGTPAQNADILTVPTSFPPQTVGGGDYTIQLSGFASPGGNYFVATGEEGTGRYRVFEDGTMFIQLWGSLTSNIPVIPDPDPVPDPTTVPESHTLTLLGFGLMGMAGLGRRLRKQNP